MPTTTPKDFLKAARRRETTYRLCVRGDLVGEHEALEAELEALQADGGWTASDLSESSPLVEVAARIKAVQAEMAENTVTLRFRALRRHDWEELLAAHPAREDREEAFNITTLASALVRECLIDPELSASEFDDLWDDIANDAQRDGMFGAAWSANTEATSVPFSERASVVTRWRAQSSKLREAGASLEASS